ncbi:transcriptional regulator, LysR family [Enhydrobacter aerosaccus]|uniref:Transcriptional regulator, LysR family n=1 Tax=Enhydrobacter aerosaccus TaxID=225324 RepID=A0A1T4T805_9HYPH|nr:LysR family transcriptional regulator [Enhydrobacter aerosaccus]SKA36650.1 transcriptional regulator, LysR family [Enhydrobacter aerosaccus]
MDDTNPSWDLYRTFRAVLQEGSLSGAARTLGLTQPTVGRHVEALERRLGVALFTRSRHGLAPTDAALALRPHLDMLETTAASLLRTASSRGSAMRGTVRVTASEVIGVEVLPPIFATLRRQHPEISVELVLSNEVTDLLRRDADIAVRMIRPRQEALLVQRVGTVKVGLHAHRLYLERHGMPASLDQLQAHALIGFDRETATIRSMQRRLPAFRRNHFSFRADSDLAQLAAIRAGFGIGACQLALATRDAALVRVLPRAFEIALETSVAMHEDLRTNRVCRAVFDALVTGMTEHVRRQDRRPR